MIEKVIIGNIEEIIYLFKYFLTRSHAYQCRTILDHVKITFSSYLVGDHLYEKIKKGSVALTVKFSHGLFPSSSRNFPVSRLERKIYNEDNEA